MSFRRRQDRPPLGHPNGPLPGYTPPTYMASGQAFIGNEHRVDMPGNHGDDGYGAQAGAPGFYKSSSISRAFGEDFRPDPNARPGTQSDMQNFVGVLSPSDSLHGILMLQQLQKDQDACVLRSDNCSIKGET
jgi:hypothetical protein